MSHPVPGHDYGEDSYESHSPHKDSLYRSNHSEKKHPFDRGSSKPSKKVLGRTHKALKDAGVVSQAKHLALKKAKERPGKFVFNRNPNARKRTAEEEGESRSDSDRGN